MPRTKRLRPCHLTHAVGVKQGCVNKAAHRQWRQADNRKNGCVKHSTPASRAERTPPGKHYRSEQASRAATSLFPCFIVNSHNAPWLIKAKINIVTQNTTKHANRYLSGFMPFTPCLSASKRLISTCWELRDSLGLIGILPGLSSFCPSRRLKTESLKHPRPIRMIITPDLNKNPNVI